MYRSTKGASKARRDQINGEIRNLKDLLPISDVDKARLSYLHIMSLACMYTRKSVFFNKDAPTTDSPEESFFSFHELSELLHEMPGFLLLLTGEGKLLFLSDSVSEHLGHSMVDLVAQGDSVYDIIDPMDHFIMRSNLVPPTTPETDRLFRCRFNTSKSVRRQSAGNKLVLIRARCLTPPVAPTSYWTSNPVWVCFCSPLEPHPPRPGPAPAPEPESSRRPDTEDNLFLACFYSQHSRDMRLQEAQDSVSDYLGLDVETLRSRSWYSLLHPQDLTHASAQHCSLLREGGEGRVEMVVRVEGADHSWVWLYMVLQLEAGEHPIRSNNFVISESEAWSVRQQLSTEQSQLTLVLGSSSTSQPEGTSLQSPGTLSSPDQVFTPGSSGLSGQSFDFSTTMCSSSEEQASSSKTTAEVGGEGPRSSLSSLEEESFFQQLPPSGAEPLVSPSAASSPIPVTVATVPELDFLTQNILLPPSFQLEPPVPALPLPLPPVPTTQAQQTKDLVCTPPYTPQVSSGSNFPFGDPLFSFDPSGTTTPPPGSLTTTVTTTTTTASTISQSSPGKPAGSTPPPTTTLSTLLPLSLTTPTTELLFPVDPCSGTLYEKLPPTPDSPGDGDCTVMTLPEVRGPLYVDVPMGPLHCPPEGLLTPEASPGKQPYLSFFSLEPEREREKMEISLLAEHIGTLAEGLYPDPLYSKLMTSSTSEPPSPPTLDPVGLDSLFSLLGDFYPIKSWRGLDLPIFSDEDSLFEERILESLLQDLATSPCPSPTPSLSSPTQFSPSFSSSTSTTPSTTPSTSPSSPTSPMCWHPLLHFDGASAAGASHFCSVQSARRNQAAGCGAVTERAPTPGDQANREEEAEVAMEIEESPLLSSGVPMSPQLVASSVSASPPPVSPVQPGLPCAQSLLEELAALEPMFGAGASMTPGLGQQPELYQLQCHPMPQCFHKDGSGSDPPF
ncbi:neuronal PAS domain-containing protein 4A [Alosa pseudoharengus]|uniref:neuronal PAS domain-containing protein 4A n=1 Tax=Alosa pseudoharengus TaxID=34774 RepID=UPI003F8AA1FD